MCKEANLMLVCEFAFENDVTWPGHVSRYFQLFHALEATNYYKSHHYLFFNIITMAEPRRADRSLSEL